MIGIVIVGHSNISKEFLVALEHIVGKQEHVAAISIFPNDDVKKKREEIYEYFRLNKGFEYNYQIIFGKKKFIERFNIHNVVLQSMKQSIILLSKKSDTIIIDGKFIPSEMKGYKVKSLIKADDKINQVSAASIIAKVFRDKLLLKLHSLDGNYQWNKNAGYGTKSHLSAIYTHGVSKYHRTTYQPISKLIKKLST